MAHIESGLDSEQNPEGGKNPEVVKLERLLLKAKPPYLAHVFLNRGEVLASHPTSMGGQDSKDIDGERWIIGGSEEEQQMLRSDPKIRNPENLRIPLEGFRDQQAAELRQKGEVIKNFYCGLVVSHFGGKEDQVELIFEASTRGDGRGGSVYLIFVTQEAVANEIVRIFQNSQGEAKEKMDALLGYMDPQLPGLQPIYSAEEIRFGWIDGSKRRSAPDKIQSYYVLGEEDREE